MVVPILLYGADVWGVYNIKEVDKLHLRFCKYILGVKKQTPNAAVYGELGRFPLSTLCKERAINFWYKIMTNTQSPIYEAYVDQCNNVISTCWAKRINSIIDHLGFANIRINFDNNFNCVPTLKRRLKDQFIQEWGETINSMPKLVTYCKFKNTFCFEEYLNKLHNNDLRQLLARFRLSSHNLEIETGRYNRIDRDSRYCKLCNQNRIENEYHFLLCCPKYIEIRRKYLGSNQWPTVNKFNNLMSMTNKISLLNVAKCIKECMSLRKISLENLAAL